MARCTDLKMLRQQEPYTTSILRRCFESSNFASSLRQSLRKRSSFKWQILIFHEQLFLVTSTQHPMLVIPKSALETSCTEKRITYQKR